MLLYPFFGVLLTGLLMQFVIEPPVGWVNMQLNAFLNSMNGTSSVILGAILGGMMAIDMGGPFNKAAYVFGTAALASGNYEVMAAVMIGGMVPPIAIALASMIFKNKFTESEQKTAPTNVVMGLSFITEGAIPFAASDPLHVLPACAIASAVAGALSMMFGCTLMAPSWRNLRIYHRRKSLDVSAGTGCRKHCWRTTSWTAAQTGKGCLIEKINLRYSSS